MHTHTLGSCKNLAYQACRKILHILPENLVCLLKNLANCKRNGHNLTRTCKNLTSTGLQDFLQALQPCKTLILHARILQESCKIFYRNLARCKWESCMTTILHAHELLLWKPVAPPTSFQSTVILHNNKIIIHTTIIIIIIVQLCICGH